MTATDSVSRERRAYFDGLYTDQAEPWTYSARAAEVLRHETLEQNIRALRSRFERVLDIGCSQGQLTARLVGITRRYHAMDLSAFAIVRARERCAIESARAGVPNAFSFCQGSSLKLPFRSGSFDLVMLCDGLHSWQLEAEEQAVALAEAHRVLVPGGYAVLSEHMRPVLFDTLIGRVRSSPLDVVEVRYLHNRLWYSFERGLGPLQKKSVSRALLASRRVARLLQSLSRLAGRRGAKHLYIVGQKRPQRADPA